MKLLLRTLLTLLVTSSSLVAASEAPHKTLNLLYAIQGTHTLGGMHNKEPNADPLRYSSQLNGITGNWPGLHSGDFLFAAVDINNRQTMINEIIAQWNAGAVVNLMWHACNPVGTSPCQWSGGVIAELTDPQWTDLLTDGTVLNNRWKARMDEVAVFLQQLEDAGVEVMFRPLHEMNQSLFWWGGRPGVNGTARLYQLTHDYFKHTKGLSNLIWVWNLQDFSTLPTDVDDYDPGHEYWDVFSMDMYWSDGQGYTTEKYNAIRNKAAGKPIAIGEAEDLPSPTLFENGQPDWSFFMGWSELTFNNSNEKLNTIFHSPRVITRDEMPGWDNLSYQVIQAEDYTNMDGVETATVVDGTTTEVVGSVDAWDWMSYASIDIPVDGLYTFAFRVLSNAGATLQLEGAGGVLATREIAATDDQWITVYKTVSLTQGAYEFGIKSIEGSFSLNWFSLSSVHGIGDSSGSSSSQSSSSASSVSPVTYPIHIEAESYSNMDGVAQSTDDDGGTTTVVSSFDAWEWMSYSAINLPESGSHIISYRVKTSSAAILQLEEAGTGVYGTINIPSTEGEWTTVTQTVELDAGMRSFGLKVTEGSISLNWFSVACAECVSSSSSSDASNTSASSATSSASSMDSSSSTASNASSSISSSETGSSSSAQANSSAQQSSRRSSGGGNTSISLLLLLTLLSIARSVMLARRY